MKWAVWWCGGTDDDDLLQLDSLTSPENLEAFRALYIKCVTRDTPIAGTEIGPALFNHCARLEALSILGPSA